MKKLDRAIFSRMLESGGLKNNSELARVLGVTPQAISNYRRRGAMPASLIIRFSEKFKVSMDWLLTGGAEYPREGSGMPVYSIGTGLSARETSDVDFWSMEMSPDEIIWLGKALSILRGRQEIFSLALKASIDLFHEAQA